MLEELEVAAEATVESGFPVRTDWRTGKPMVERDDAFWREQERRRLELGMSIRQFCAAHDLALSTYRHRVSGRPRTSAKGALPAAPPQPPSFIAVTAASDESDAIVEVALDGMTLRLHGVAADRVVDRVLARLA